MDSLATAITLFFVLDPFGNLPATLVLVAPFPRARRWRVVARESLIALGLLVLFYALGPWCVRQLGVDAADLQICGGAVLGIIALRMIFPEHRAAAATGMVDEEPFIVPIAIPLIAGPSALAMVMILSARSADRPWDGLGMLIAAWAACAVLLLMGVVAGSRIPARLMPALERLSGLLLAVIAVRMVMTGVRTYLVAQPAGG